MFQPNFCIFPYPFVKKEIVALLLNRNTEAERFLGGFTDMLEHFWAALHQMIFGSKCNARTKDVLVRRNTKSRFVSYLVIIFPPVVFRWGLNYIFFPLVIYLWVNSRAITFHLWQMFLLLIPLAGTQ